MENNLESQVEAILKAMPETRNSDIALMIEIWKKYYPQWLNFKEGEYWSVSFKNLYELPREDNIKRLRARFCEQGFAWAFPTSFQVAKTRKINEQIWRLKLGYAPEDFVTKCFDGRCVSEKDGVAVSPCPNVRPGYKYHTEVKCQKCGKHYLWGISWDQNKEKDFICTNCINETLCGKPHNNGDPTCAECETIKSTK